jgi:hypothetical protein
LLEPRRASVAILLRVVPSPSAPPPPTPSSPPDLEQFFSLDWVNDPNARAEILFLQRENSIIEGEAPQISRKGEVHVAFPGGRTEPDDEGGLYTGAFHYI